MAIDSQRKLTVWGWRLFSTIARVFVQLKQIVAHCSGGNNTKMLRKFENIKKIKVRQ